MTIQIKCDSGEHLEKVLKRFKKLCEKEGLIKDIRRNMYYEKPSAKRRRKRRASIQRILKDREKLQGKAKHGVKLGKKNDKASTRV